MAKITKIDENTVEKEDTLTWRHKKKQLENSRAKLQKSMDEIDEMLAVFTKQ